MKKIICTILLAQGAFLGAAETNKTKECIDTVLQIDTYRTQADKILPMMPTKMTIDEFMDKIHEGYAKKDLQNTLKEKFTERFSPEQIDEIYTFINSDLYKKYNKELTLFTIDTSPEMGKLIIDLIQAPTEQIAVETPQEAVSTNKIIVANESNWEAILQENENVIIDVYANWCGPCKALSPILTQLSEEFDGKYVFVKIDTDTNRELVSKLKVKGLPTLLFYKGGKEVHRKTGFANKEQLVDLMKNYFEA